jgi:HSP20 family molecular chaperone IbpA
VRRPKRSAISQGNGVLEVRIPKPEQAQATKVEIGGQKQEAIDV